MEVKPNNYCILIASHISKGERVCYLKECLNSLINQTMKVPIYVSISFENMYILIFYRIRMNWQIMKEAEMPQLKLMLKKKLLL